MRTTSNIAYQLYRANKRTYHITIPTKEEDFLIAMEALRALSEFWKNEKGPYVKKDFINNNDPNIQQEGQIQAVLFNRLKSAISKGYQPAMIYYAGMMIGLNKIKEAYKLIFEITVLNNKNENDHHANYLLALAILKAYGERVIGEENDFTPILNNVLRNERFLTYIRKKFDFVDKPKILAQLLQACGPDYQEKIRQQTKMARISAKVTPHNEMYTELKDQYNVLRLIYHIAYGNVIESDPLTQKVKESLSNLKKIKLTEDDWNVIYSGFTHGKSSTFLTKLKEYGVYSMLFGPQCNQTPKQVNNNDDWLIKRFKELDNSVKKNNNYPFSLRAAALLVSKELTSESTLEDARKVHQQYQITYPFDYTFKLQLEACRNIIPPYTPIENKSTLVHRSRNKGR